MVIKETRQLYDAFLRTDFSRWEYGNSVLYRMCEEEPGHQQADIIAGKILLIGRTYAAAIERRKNKDGAGDDFYFSRVAPKMLEIGPELDGRIKELRETKRHIADNVEAILGTHKFLTDAFFELTGLEKRSLASKYLHFHCPKQFFIYDSRASVGVRKLVKRPDKRILSRVPDYDPEYGDFVSRMLELQAYLEKCFGVYELPRKLDNFLLSSIVQDDSTGE